MTKEKVPNQLFEAGLQSYVKVRFTVLLIDKPNWQCVNEETTKAFICFANQWAQLTMPKWIDKIIPDLS